MAEVSEVRDKEKEPQCDGRGEGGQGDNLEGSNDDEMCTRSIEEGGSKWCDRAPMAQSPL